MTQAPLLAQPLNGNAAEAADPTDLMLDALAIARDAREAQGLEAQILSAWGKSGSDTVDLLMQWAGAAMQDKDYPLAIDLLSEVVLLKPDYAEGWNKRATVYYLIDEYALSMADIRHVLLLQPRHFGALSGMALIFKETGNKAQALNAFRQALDIHPFLTNARDAVAALEAEVDGQGI